MTYCNSTSACMSIVWVSYNHSYGPNAEELLVRFDPSWFQSWSHDLVVQPRNLALVQTYGPGVHRINNLFLTVGDLVSLSDEVVMMIWMTNAMATSPCPTKPLPLPRCIFVPLPLPQTHQARPSQVIVNGDLHIVTVKQGHIG